MDKNKEKIYELFSLLCGQMGETPLGKKASQKMFYFFERKGISLNLRYGIHFYGPYSSRLDTEMHVLESEDLLSIDTTGMTHVISLKEAPHSINAMQPKEQEMAESVITLLAHKSASELEALATLDYVANTMMKNTNKEDVIKTFKSIKGEKFSDEEIESSFCELQKDGYIVSR